DELWRSGAEAVWTARRSAELSGNGESLCAFEPRDVGGGPVSPAELIATKYEHDDPHARVERTMPLCPYPAMVQCKGQGDVNDASNWKCPANDHRLLEKGAVGA